MDSNLAARRFSVPDPATNAALADLQNYCFQLAAQIKTLQTPVVTAGKYTLAAGTVLAVNALGQIISITSP